MIGNAAVGLITAILAAEAAHAQGYEAEGRALRECYDGAAAYYGARTCDPPAALLGAIFGRCTKEEGAFRRAVEASTRSDKAFSDAVMLEIQKTRSQKLQSIIVDAGTI